MNEEWIIDDFEQLGKELEEAEKTDDTDTAP